MAWCVLRVRPGYELAAVDWMNERAITAYTPSAKRRVRRRYPRTGHDVVEVAAFPGYAFASTDVRFVDTERCPGAVSLIDGLASDAEVQTVSFREAEGEFDLIPADAPPPAFMVGDRVATREGSSRSTWCCLAARGSSRSKPTGWVRWAAAFAAHRGQGIRTHSPREFLTYWYPISFMSDTFRTTIPTLPSVASRRLLFGLRRRVTLFIICLLLRLQHTGSCVFGTPGQPGSGRAATSTPGQPGSGRAATSIRSKARIASE